MIKIWMLYVQDSRKPVFLKFEKFENFWGVSPRKWKKIYKRDIQRPGLLGWENKLDQRSYIFYKLPLFLFTFSNENNIAKIVAICQVMSIIVQFNSNKHDFWKLPFTNVLQTKYS